MKHVAVPVGGGLYAAYASVVYCRLRRWAGPVSRTVARAATAAWRAVVCWRVPGGEVT